MLKVLINEEEVIANQNFTINKHMLNTPSVILNNVCPKEWKENRNYSGFYHPLDYSKCKILDVPTEEEKIGQYQKITNSGTITNVDSTKENEITQLDGLTTQEGTPTPDTPQPVNVVSGRQEISVCGKNLLGLKNGTYTANDITAVVENGEITLNGTAGSTRFVSISLNNIISWENGRKYTISAFNSVANSNLKIRINSGGQLDTTLNAVNKTQTITYSGETDILNNSITIRVASGATLTNYKLKPMIEYGETGSSYEQYNGNIYEINLGKNLWNYEFEIAEYNSSGVKVSTNVWLVNTTKIPVLPNTQYTISQKEHPIQYRIICFNGTTYLRQFSSSQNTTTGLSSYTFTTPNNCNGIYIQFRSTIERIATGTYTVEIGDITNAQLEKGSVASPYSAYKTPIELCKIGNYQDFIKKGTGKNLLETTNWTNAYIDSSGIVHPNANTNALFDEYISVKPNTKYTLSTNQNVNNTAISEFNSSKTFIKRNQSSYNSSTLTITTGENTTYVRVQMNYNNSTTITQTIIDSVLIELELGENRTPYEPYGMYNKWYIEKQIGKVVLNGSETYGVSATYTNNTRFTGTSLFLNLGKTTPLLSNYFVEGTGGTDTTNIDTNGHTGQLMITIPNSIATSVNQLTTWLSTHNTIVYYVLATPTYTEITDSELIGQLNSVKLIEGLNNISITSPYLSTPITFHYNYWFDKLLFCGVVKNSGKISLNPREPHLTTLQILDFKDFLSSGETLDYVIYQKTIREAIEQVISSISDYGFILGNLNILNENDIIGAYSTKDKTAYDVFNYIADITQSRWTTRMINENQVAIDFYDPTLMPEGTEIDYTDTFFKNNLIDDMSYNYGTNNYRNKQVMISSQTYSNINQEETGVANGYQTQYITELPIGKINSMKIDDSPASFTTHEEKDIGYTADFYYTPGENIFESEIVQPVGKVIEIDYIPIVEGRQVITNNNEIERVSESINRKGIVARYETRNDATTSSELQKIGESYIKYKGTPEIVLKIKSRTNIWEVGQRVQFNAPINELQTEYMVRTKKIDYIASVDTIFYTYELVSSFNSETEINYFDNQRAKANGNIGEGEYISRNVDIESTANIIFYDTTINETTITGDNTLNSILNSPLVN